MNGTRAGNIVTLHCAARLDLPLKSLEIHGGGSRGVGTHHFEFEPSLKATRSSGSSCCTSFCSGPSLAKSKKIAMFPDKKPR